MTEQTKRVMLTAGPVEFYEAGSGLPLLLLHGALANAHNWDGSHRSSPSTIGVSSQPCRSGGIASR